MNQSLREQKVQSLCLLVLTSVAVGITLYWLRAVLIPFVLALFIASGVAPYMEWAQNRLKMPRMLAIATGVGIALSILVILWSLLWVSVVDLAQNSVTYQNRFNDLIERTVDWVPVFIVAPAGAESNAEKDAEDKAENSVAADDGETRRMERRERARRVADQKIHELASYLRQKVGYVLLQLSGSLMDVLSQAAIVGIYLLFLLMGDTVSENQKSGVWTDIESRIRNYIITKTVISLVTGALFGTVLWFFGVPLAMVFGVLAFLLNFIPNIGPIIASLLPLPLIMLHPELSAWQTTTVIALSFSVQFVSGNVIEPKVMGSSFNLHPVAVLVMLMFWGMIWGIVGMLLATPITAALKILCERIDRLRPVAYILEGRFDKLSDVSRSVLG
ncbi:MAG: AI-2E family transporter [Pirellulaceae bacterium]